MGKEKHLKEMEWKHSSLAAQYQSAEEARHALANKSSLSTKVLRNKQYASKKAKTQEEPEEHETTVRQVN